MKQSIIILLIANFLCISHPASTQEIWETYSRTDGLSGDSVFCIAQDKFGNYWFGTWNAGLSKLDTNGIWTNFMNGADSNFSVYDIEIDSFNNKWLTGFQVGGTYDGGTYVVNFNDSCFTYYNPTGIPYSDPKPTCLGQDSSGNIWCGTTLGVAYWLDVFSWHSFYVLPPGDWSFINEIVTDRHGNLYFAHDMGISTLIDKLFWGWWTTDIAFDRQNRMWFATSVSPWGLGMYDGENWYAYTKEDGLLDDDVLAVAIDSSNNVWIANGSNGGQYYGVSKFNGYKFTHFNHEDGLAHDYVWDIYVDNKGDIWFATNGGGVSVLRNPTTTGIKKNVEPINNARECCLFQNYPNPFNAMTLIKYNLTNADRVELSIYNLMGKEVITLVNEQQSAGEHQVIWEGVNKDGKEASSGIYIAVLKWGALTKNIKLNLIH